MKPVYPIRKSGSRILTWVLAATLLSIITVSIFTYLSYQRAASDLVIERDRQLIYLSAVHLKEEMTRYTEILESVARTAEMTSGELNLQASRLEKSSLRLAVFDGGVILMNNFGRVIASVPERSDILYQDWSDRAYFRQLLISSTDYYSNIVQDGPGGSEVVVISVPVFGGNGEFIGALAGMFRLDATDTSSFYASIVRLRIGQNGSTYILDKNNRLVYSATQAEINSVPEEIAPAWLDIQGENNAIRTKDGYGKDVVLAHASIPGTTWTLVTEDDWQTLTSATRPYANILLSMLGLGMLLPATLVAFILRRRDREIRSIERIKQEHNLIDEMLEVLVPEHAPMLPEWEIALSTQAYDRPENDFHDFMFLPDGRLMIAIGTINLSGVNALVTHTSIRANLRNAALCGFTPAEALSRSNAVVFADMKEDQSADCLFAILDPAAHRLSYAAAGLQFMAHIKDKGDPLLELNSPALGASLECEYTNATLDFKPGERLVLFTNGIFRSPNAAGKALEHERIISQLKRKEIPLQPIMENLLYHYRDFVKDTLHQAKDITLIAVERQLPQTQNVPSQRARVLKNLSVPAPMEHSDER